MTADRDRRAPMRDETDQKPTVKLPGDASRQAYRPSCDGRVGHHHGAEGPGPNHLLVRRAHRAPATTWYGTTARQRLVSCSGADPSGRLAGVIPADPPNTAGQTSARHVRIMHLSALVFRALAGGDLAAANAMSPVPLSEYFAGPDWRGTWRMRSEQVEQDPASAAWVTGVIWDELQQVSAGRAGYHGPPDQSGMVEIGYAVDPAYRRRGYARAALEALLQRAADEPGVKTVRATISPDNVASYALVAQYGFTKVGEQWDEEDGLEIIYEVAAGQH
jgi:RimJ/RimL family protein N-acetyltransferase